MQVEKKKGMPRGMRARDARKAKEAKLTRSRLIELLSYEPETGLFRWRTAASPRVKDGKVAGCAMPSGYIVIRIDGTGFSAHRLAWLYVYGRWPDEQIDHINALRADNRIANLRDVTPSGNQGNRRHPFTNNKLGVLGVRCRYGRYHAVIGLNNKLIELGIFDTAEEASAAYLAAKAIYHPTSPIAEGR